MRPRWTQHSCHCPLVLRRCSCTMSKAGTSRSAGRRDGSTSLPLQVGVAAPSSRRESGGSSAPTASAKKRGRAPARGTAKAKAKAKGATAPASEAKAPLPSMIGKCVCSRCSETSDTKPWACSAETPGGKMAAGSACLACYAEWNEHFSHIPDFDGFVAHCKTPEGIQQAADAKMNAQRQGGTEFRASHVCSAQRLGCVLKRSLVILNKHQYKEAITKAPTKRHPRCPKLQIVNEEGEAEEVYCFANPLQPHRTLELYCDMSEDMVTPRLEAGKNAFEAHAHQTMMRCASARSESLGHQILFSTAPLHPVDYVKQKVIKLEGKLAAASGEEGGEDEGDGEDAEGGMPDLTGMGGEVRIVHNLKRSNTLAALPNIAGSATDKLDAVPDAGPTPKKPRCDQHGLPAGGLAVKPKCSPTPSRGGTGAADPAASACGESDARTVVGAESGVGSDEGSDTDAGLTELQKWVSKLALVKVVSGAKLQRQVRFAVKSLTTKMNKNDAGLMREHLKLVPALSKWMCHVFWGSCRCSWRSAPRLSRSKTNMFHTHHVTTFSMKPLVRLRPLAL